jgi:hypothetical protein
VSQDKLSWQEVRMGAQEATSQAPLPQTGDTSPSGSGSEDLKTIARLCAELLGGLCVIRMLSPDGRLLVPVAVAHADQRATPPREAIAPISIEDPESAFARAVATASPAIAPIARPEDARMLASPGHWEYVESLDVRSLLIAPLVDHDRVVGALSLWRGGDREPHTPSDAAFAQRLAALAALALTSRLPASMAQPDADETVMGATGTLHRLREELTTITLCAQLLARYSSSPGGGAQPFPANVLERIELAAARMAALLRRLGPPAQ